MKLTGWGEFRSITPGNFACFFIVSFLLLKLTHLKKVFGKYHDSAKQFVFGSKIVSEYDQEIPQSQTADSPVAPRGRAAQPPRDTRKTNQAKQSALSSPSR